MTTQIQRMDLSNFESVKPNIPINLLFIHHSCGATLMAASGEKAGEYCLWETHPNGGGLRKKLLANNYIVHEATYSSIVGQDTDINHWHSKFQKQMNLILKTRLQDETLEDGQVNQIVVFKSCYPNNGFTNTGSSPGDPDSSEKTVWNAKAAYNSLLPIFKKHSDTLFIAVTAPPMVKPWVNRYKEILLNIIGKGPEKIGERARSFNNWLVDAKSGWLADYKQNNVLVFDLYDILTDNGVSNWAQYSTRNGKNSHPNSQGNTKAAKQFVEFINQSVRHAGLVDAK